MGSLLQMRDVRLIYGRRRPTLALDGLDLAINEGAFVAVVGPSGCGKSSLMKLVTGLRRPSAGSIAVAGKEVNGPLKIVGMAFQNPTLLPWRTTLSNVMLPLEIVEPHRQRLRQERARYRQQADALLALVGLKNFGEQYPWQLSGGMQQRASLCRALIHEPALLMLDEPFGALDAFTREELWDVLQELDAAPLHHRPGHARPARGRLSRRYRARDVEPARTNHRHPRRADRAAAPAAHRL
jgi:NitT/TauT family transport system ATP-binding protein